MLGRSSTGPIAVASVGSGSVSFGIAERTPGGTFGLVAQERLTLPLEKRTQAQSIAGLKQRLLDASRRALATYSATGATRPIHAVHVVIRAPWAQSRTILTEKKYDTETHITAAAIVDLTKRALEEARAPRANFLEASVERVALNGYATEHPEGKYAHSLEISTLVCAGDPALRTGLQEALGGVFPASQVYVHAGTRGILEAVNAAGLHRQDCLVLDVGEDGTAAINIRDGVAESEAFIEEGTRSILVRVLPTSAPEETLGALRMMARDECSQGTCLMVQEGFAKMEPELAHIFGEFFAKMNSSRKLPNAIILIAHPDISTWLSRFFSRIDFTQFTLTAQPFETIPLVPPGTVLHGEDQNIPAVDTDLGIALALINKEAR